ncbi:hypothetical protein [Fusibacter sp. 3D3]|uniref:hypothetical protein n=1 Tax=Fusibacter sp. 3D3 TaxID=1048380 RepID=UPI000852CE5F|nr:hypothetical protein [Fusibacter sp. 3D3]GAU75864.1 hypothetical protein F3D3_0460 [Fusibacter sp. 3D3]
MKKKSLQLILIFTIIISIIGQNSYASGDTGHSEAINNLLKHDYVITHEEDKTSDAKLNYTKSNDNIEVEVISVKEYELVKPNTSGGIMMYSASASPTSVTRVKEITQRVNGVNVTVSSSMQALVIDDVFYYVNPEKFKISWQTDNSLSDGEGAEVDYIDWSRKCAGKDYYSGVLYTQINASERFNSSTGLTGDSTSKTYSGADMYLMADEELMPGSGNYQKLTKYVIASISPYGYGSVTFTNLFAGWD